MQCEDASVTTCSLVPAELKMCCGLLQAALNLTDAQQVDMMYLWQIFNASLEALSRERKRLLSQVPTGTLESASQASIRFIDVANRAHQVHNNCVAGLKTCRQLTSAYNCGVRPNILAYLSLVHAESADSLTHTHIQNNCQGRCAESMYAQWQSGVRSSTGYKHACLGQERIV